MAPPRLSTSRPATARSPSSARRAQGPGALPAHWLTHFEPFVTLVGAHVASTPIGLRDQIVLRLGLNREWTQELVACWSSADLDGARNRYP